MNTAKIAQNKGIWLIIFQISILWLITSNLIAQKSFFEPDSNYNPHRVMGLSLSSGIMVTCLYGYLGYEWYGNSTQGKFHFFNDSHEWKQMDKLGHAFTAYQESRAAITLLKWAGIKKHKALWIGSFTGIALQCPIEIFDGFSTKWGASVPDLIANTLGSSLALGNQLLWDEQRIQLKFSFLPSGYAKLYPNKLGKSLPEQILKDYNGQTYWLSFRVKSFLPEGNFKKKYPGWLNICIGHGAGGMIGGYGMDPLDEIEKREFRRFYLGLDVDLSRIKTKNYFLKALLGGLNCIRIPFPAIEFNRNGVLFHAIKF